MNNRQEQIEQAKRLIVTGISEDLVAVLHQQFPELKESEDERIRKMLVEQMERWKKCAEDNNVKQDVKDASAAIAYLEKQKEPHYSPLCNTIKDKIREYIANYFIADTVVRTDMKSIVKAMEEGVRLGNEEKRSAEWSEEDEAKKERLISIVKRALHGNEYPILNDNGATELITWLKSLRPQPKSIISDTDKSNLKDAPAIIRKSNHPFKENIALIIEKYL